MKTKIMLIACSLFWANMSIAQQSEPLFTGKEKIIISSDGNEHDPDDWAATPVSLAILAARGIQNNLILYTYSDHIWGSNAGHPMEYGMSAYDHMRHSALAGADKFGFDREHFVCAVDDPETAYDAMAKAINTATKKSPVIILGAGPMQVIGEGINRAKKEKLQYVTVVSHGRWNDVHAETDGHSGWTWDKMKEAFGTPGGGGAKFVHTIDQNGNNNRDGLNIDRKRYDWVKTSSARDLPAYQPGSWDWLYGRLEVAPKKNGANFDPSDAGMVLFILSGKENNTPEDLKAVMENPAGRKRK